MKCFIFKSIMHLYIFTMNLLHLLSNSQKFSRDNSLKNKKNNIFSNNFDPVYFLWLNKNPNYLFQLNWINNLFVSFTEISFPATFNLTSKIFFRLTYIRNSWWFLPVIKCDLQEYKNFSYVADVWFSFELDKYYSKY